MSIYQHYREHEHPFIDQVLSWISQVEQSYMHYVSDYLDPREQQIVASLIGTNNEEIKFRFFGGPDHAERKRAIIAPFYEEITDDMFEIVLLEASFPEKFVSIAHRDILGAFTAQGIERKKIGDIVVGEDVFQFYTTEELKTYVKLNLTEVKNAHIRLKKQSFSEAIEKKEKWQRKRITATSLRLDIIIKETYNLSRKNAAKLIERNLVRVNFANVDNPATLLIENDLISVRGHGRSKLLEVNGLTRKEKVRVVVGTLTV